MTDRFTIRVVVFALAFAVLGGLAALAYLSFTGTMIPDQLDRLVTFLAGALTSVLATTRSTGEDAQPVTVQNQPSDPIPVEETTPAKRGKNK